MKISATATIVLGFSAPLISVEASLKGTRQLQTATDRIEIELGDNPTLEQIEDLIDGFCDLCCVGDILGQDQTFCFMCPDDACDSILGVDVTTPFCFSAISTVQLENFGSVSMKNLQVGDRVLTSSGAYEPVYAFGHKNPTESADFLQFKTAGSKLEMTGGHLVFLDGKTNPVRADSVKVGDVLRTAEAGAKITKISNVQRDGVYSPLTPGGTVVVDGIVASTYISLQKDADEHIELQGGISTFMSYQDFIHMTLSPFRMLAMGVSSTIANVYTEEGIPVYASYGMDFAEWANNQNIVVQAVLLLAVLSLAGASMVVENTFGASVAPLALVAGAGAYAVMKKNSIRFRANKIKSV